MIFIITSDQEQTISLAIAVGAAHVHLPGKAARRA
jgi:hypothetical protein